MYGKRAAEAKKFPRCRAAIFFRGMCPHARSGGDSLSRGVHNTILGNPEDRLLYARRGCSSVPEPMVAGVIAQVSAGSRSVASGRRPGSGE